jgi:glutathione synthase/RimK-type ligase-like ATP-grasp enzyme
VEFAQSESKRTLMWLWDILREKFWVNHPRNNVPAGSKLYQNEIAKKNGIKIPDSLITNEPKEAERFIKKYRIVAIKPISGGFIKRGNKFKYIYTNVITQENARDIELVKYCPTLLQEYIPKNFELRITVIGNEIFACKIDSQKSEKTKYDWRRYDNENVPHTLFELPRRIKSFCFEIVNHFDLNFGAIDMIVTPNNEYVFLELNPNGQWGWIENLAGIPISEAVIKTLTEMIKTPKLK